LGDYYEKVLKNGRRKPKISRKANQTIILGPISAILKAAERLTPDGFR
jgi:hypothetical protein